MACDLCAVYSAAEAQGQAAGVYGAASEQFTRYDQLRLQGHRVDDDVGQFLQSSVTQLIVGYGFSERFSAQLALPVIDRLYRRPNFNAPTEEGTEGGPGDVTVIASYAPLLQFGERSTLAGRLYAGIKLPTGNSDRLEEELPPPSIIGSKAEDHLSGIHGHDLALGSGSTDFLFGASIRAGMRHWLTRAEVQYAYRRRGDFGYRFGDDVQWGMDVGRYLLLADERTLAALIAAEGEYKKFDDLDGVQADDSHSGGWMLGPKLQFTWRSRLSAELAGLLPVQTFNTELQVTAGYRIQAAVGYRF